MKKIILLTVFAAISSFALFTQTPPPPPDNPSNGGNDPVGGGAPVGSGIVILITMSAGYGAKKMYDFMNKLEG